MANNRTWRERRERNWGAPVPSNVTHGGQVAKYIYGCDCKVCYPDGRGTPHGQGKSSKQRNKEYRARKQGQPVPEGAHGATGWTYYSCRCEVCTTWHRERRAAYRNAWRKTARGHWHTEERDGKLVEVIHWPPRELEEPWLCPTCGEFKVMP